MRSRAARSLLLVVLAAGCSDPAASPDASVSPDGLAPDAAVAIGPCDVLDPDECLLPWPSSHFLVGEGAARRVVIPPEAMPANATGTRIDPTPWNRFDGFSPMTTMIARVRGLLDGTGLTSWRDPAPSLAPTSPTILYDATAGARLAHFAEIEPSSDDPAHTVLYVRPAARLPAGHHIVVALRDLRDTTGAPIAPEPSFVALRDGAMDAPAAVLARRESFAREVLEPLDAAGVERGSLVLAWDCWTATEDAIAGDLVAMRDAALASTTAPACTVSSATTDGIAAASARARSSGRPSLRCRRTSRASCSMVAGSRTRS